MSDDYENFAIIYNRTKRISTARQIIVTEMEAAEALRNAIAEGYAEAYVLSPKPPHATKVDYDENRRDEL